MGTYHGGLVYKMKITFHKPLIEYEEIEAVVDTLKSGWLTTGPKVKKIEQAFCEYTGTKHAIDKLKDILGWDTINWSQALHYWDKFIPQENTSNLTALELGSGFNGGLSLWLALKKIKTTCSGYHPRYVGASDKAKLIHHKYDVKDFVEYKEVDARHIPHKSQYDIICYKSMLGGIVAKGEFDTAKKVIDGIYEALKPGGILLFAENILSTSIHQIIRNRYGSGKQKWRYFTIGELIKLHGIFNSFEYQTYGFLGCFGVSEKQRSILGRIDRAIFNKILPERLNYILAGVAIKEGGV